MICSQVSKLIIQCANICIFGGAGKRRRKEMQVFQTRNAEIENSF